MGWSEPAGLCSGMQNHRKLRVYQEAKVLALQAYAVAAALPPSERYGLAAQLRRAAVSVGSNIAEGRGRTTARDLRGFLSVALGSAAELEFQLELCQGTGLAADTLVTPALQTTRRVQQMLTRLAFRVQSTITRAQRA